MKLTIFKLTIPLSFGLIASAGAAVTYVGSIADDAGSEATAWATSSTAKTYDGDNNDVYGTYSHEFIGISNTNPAASVSFVSIGAGMSVVGPFAGYATVDNNAGGTAQVRTLTGSALTNLITYQFDAADIATVAANGMRIGMWTDGLDAAAWSGATYGVEHVRAGGVIGSATTTLTPNSTIDAHFFNITGIQTGDQFRFIQGALGGNGAGSATLQAYTADIIAVPEPSSAALLGLGGLALILRRRK